MLRERLSRVFDHDRPNPFLVAAGILLIGMIVAHLPILLGYAGVHGIISTATSYKLANWVIVGGLATYIIGGGLRKIGVI